MSLRLRLKEETALPHRQLESQLDLASPSFGVSELVRLLERFYGYYATCEAQLACAPPELTAFFDPRRKLPLLASDLKQLGYREEAIAQLPVCPLPPAATNSQMLGRWYVLEGSTLGGQLVAKMLGDRLSLRPGQCRFFLSYGDEVGNKWREFCGLLDTYSSPESNDAVIEAADQTFQSLAAWMR